MTTSLGKSFNLCDYEKSVLRNDLLLVKSIQSWNLDIPNRLHESWLPPNNCLGSWLEIRVSCLIRLLFRLSSYRIFATGRHAVGKAFYESSLFLYEAWDCGKRLYLTSLAVVGNQGSNTASWPSLLCGSWTSTWIRLTGGRLDSSGAACCCGRRR